LPELQPPSPDPAGAGTTFTNPQPGLSAPWKPRVNPWLIAMTVALAAFMEVLDTSIANVALPHIAGSLGASTNEGTWVLTSYLVANAIVLPMGGWASSVLGRRNFFVLCIVIFTVSSFLCGAAPSLPLLLIFRILQGAGGGGMQPMAQAIMADSFEPQKRGQAFALYGLVAVLAPSIGPTLGGWITDNFSWRWIFFINIPVGILAFILVSRLVEDPPWIKADRSRLRHMDYLGLSFLTIAMGGLQIMLDKGEENDWFSSGFICFFAFLFIFGIVGLILWEWNHKNPLINLKLFRFKNFAICCFLMALVGGVLNANTVLQPQFMQQLLGWTATISGMALTAGGVVLLFVMPMAGYATGKVAARCGRLHSVCHLLPLRRHGHHAKHDLCLRLLAARRPDDSHPLLLHLHHHRSLRGHAQGAEQPGSRPHQLRPQHRRKHPDRSHQCAGDQPRLLAPAASAKLDDRGFHRLSAAVPSADRLLRRRFRLCQRQGHGPGLHLQPAQYAGPGAGLPGCLHGAVVDVRCPGRAGLHAQQKQARRGSWSLLDALRNGGEFRSQE